MSEISLTTPARPGGPLRVGYILKQYPRLSETFILNEILGLEDSGVDVSIFSLRNATEGRFHPAIASVKGTVHYVGEANKATFLEALRSLPNLRSEELPAVLAFLDRLPSERRSRIALQAIEVARHASESGIDHLHAHFMTVAAHTAHLVSLLTGIPYSVTAHAKDIYRHTVDWEVAATMAAAAKAVVTVCDANLQYLSHRLDGSNARLVRIYNGLGPQMPPTPVEQRPNNLLVSVGRLVEKKGFDLLLEALAAVRTEHPTMRCVIVGDGDQRPGLEAQAAQLGISDIVTFTGSLPQDKVGEWLRKATLMVAPCRVGSDGNQDALPTVLLEALAAGLPAISTPVAGIPEIITDGVEGRIVPCNDLTSLSAAIIELLHDAPKRAAMSAAGPRKLATHFDRASTIQELVDTFTSLELVNGGVA